VLTPASGRNIRHKFTPPLVVLKVNDPSSPWSLGYADHMLLCNRAYHYMCASCFAGPADGLQLQGSPQSYAVVAITTTPDVS